MAFVREPFRKWLLRLEALIGSLGTGTVGGPVSSVLRRVPRWSNTNGTAIDQSLVEITDAGSINLPSGQTVDGVDVSVLGSQAAAHIADTANPHAVTKTQVGLANVTNDAQLTRGANDWSGFSTKATPVSADRILIEDSEASGAKKTVTAGDLVTSLSQNFLESKYAAVSTDISTTSTSYVDMAGASVSVTTSTGDVLVIVASFGGTNTTNSIRMQLVIDGVAVGSGASPVGGNCSVIYRVAPSAGAHTIKMQWRVTGGTGLCSVATGTEGHHAALTVERVRV